MCYKTWCMKMVDGQCVHRVCPIDARRENPGMKSMLEIVEEKEKRMKQENLGKPLYAIIRSRRTRKKDE